MRPRLYAVLPRRCETALFWCRTKVQFTTTAQNGRDIHDGTDGRARLSDFWIPTGGIASASTDQEDPHALLIRAGFLRQAHTGIYHLLPLGVRVQEKVENLISQHMKLLGASKVSLSSITSEELWRRSGRYVEGPGEYFRLKDRKQASYLLSPTHEEEITNIVANTIKSYRDCPLRLYQINRKFRDELRPRQGLLRTREFIMKDLYTFDSSVEEAMKSYDSVLKVYIKLFDQFKVPYIVAKADSGNMGGTLSHEFHLPTSRGEDDVISCSKCAWSANEEVAEGHIPAQRERPIVRWKLKEPSDLDHSDSVNELIKSKAAPDNDPLAVEISVWSTITKDKLGFVNVFYPTKTIRKDVSGSLIRRSNNINTHRIRKLVPSVNTGMETPIEAWKGNFKSVSKEAEKDDTVPPSSYIVNIFDYRIPSDFYTSTFSNHADIPISAKTSLYFSKTIPTTSISQDPNSSKPIDVLKIKEGDVCPSCESGQTKVRKAIELGHTFFLGTRYSEPLHAKVKGPTAAEMSKSRQDISREAQPLQMGCHGIGITRMIGAFAAALADKENLNWPRVMAPFEAVIIPGKDLGNAGYEVYDALSSRTQSPDPLVFVDTVLDDRDKSLAWRMKDADLIGVPVVVVLGKVWKASGKCEVQCRRLQVKEEVPLDTLRSFVQSLLSQL
ncbi:MAG: hypothetical protein M1814_006946 [Vezdaea aestivalis]|nr:MAG: hypothetical protein M1814_006946 [Vezdaea aestivalis]